MITDGTVKQETLITELSKYWFPEMLAKMKEPTADLKWLAKELGDLYEFRRFDPFDPSALDTLVSDGKPWATELKEQGKVAHTIVVDGRNSAGNIMIRDPNEATAYEMTEQEFVKYWNGRVVKRAGE